MATLTVAAPAEVAHSSFGTKTAPDWSLRIPALDGLRGIAILLVLMRHGIFGLQSSSPFVNHLLSVGRLSGSGVDLFFVLSGFLIGGILLDARESPHYYSTFYARRAYRILPLYFAVTGFFLLRHLPLRFIPGAFGDASPLSIPWFAYLTFTQNFFMVHVGWFGSTAMLVTWSLAVEEQFYLVIPFVMRKIHGQKLVLGLLAMIAGAPFLRLLMRHVLVHGDFAAFALMPCRPDSRCMGALSAYLVRRPGFWNQLKARRRLLWAAGGILFPGVVFINYTHYEPLSLAMTTWGYSWLALFYAYCLLAAVSSSAGVWHGLLCNAGLMRLGTLAYCTYLLHYPLIQAGRRLLYGTIPRHPEIAYAGGAFAAVMLTLAIATLSWRFFEKPMIRRGHRYRYF